MVIRRSPIVPAKKGKHCETPRAHLCLSLCPCLQVQQAQFTRWLTH